MTVANKEYGIQIGMMMFLQLQIWRVYTVNTKEIEIEIKGNEVEINWQRDYLQAIWRSLAQTLHRYADIHSHYAQKEDKRT